MRRFPIEVVTGDTIHTFVAKQFSTRRTQHFLAFSLAFRATFRIRNLHLRPLQVIKATEDRRQVLEVGRAILRHPGRHVMTDAFAIEEHLLHPGRLQLCPNQRERRWNTTVVAELQFAPRKERVVCVMNAAEVIANMTGDALKCGQCLRHHKLVRVGSRLFTKRCDNRLDLSVFEVEARTPTTRLRQTAACQIRGSQRTNSRSRRDAGE